MRSRYSAYARKNFDYILETTDPQHRPDFNHKLSRDWMNNCTFMGLDVLNASEEGTKAFVEFIARFRRGEGAEEKHHERSRFRKHGGVWYFREGRIVGGKP
jgi:SEC-C motif-containing protein